MDVAIQAIVSHFLKEFRAILKVEINYLMRTNVLTIFSLLTICSLFVAFQDNSLEQSVKRGEEVYNANCITCHMQKGEGMEGAYPPLAKADFIAKDKTGKQSIGAILNGLSGEITVNGKKYNVPMPAQNYLTDQQIADVLNYVRNSWGNKAKAITEAMVKAERK
jgi:mono/diheme cytochrome c family protein